MATAGTPAIIIRLVHGTWGRSRLPWSAPNWFEPESDFVKSFTQQLASKNISADIQPFLWSGKNSLYARSDASLKLASIIERDADKYPGVRQVVVGHSHGGSVALLAMRRLWTSVDPIVVTLATPFMEIVRSRPVGEDARIKRYIGSALPSMGLLVAIAWLYILLNIHDYDPSFLYINVLMIALRLLPDLYGVGKLDPPDEMSWLSPQSPRPEVYQALTVGGATLAPARRTLVIRGVDDEAGLILAAGSIANRLATIATNYTITATTLGLCACLMAVGLIFLDQHFAGLSQSLSLPVNLIRRAASHPYVAYSAMYLIAIFFLFPIISGVFKSVYGREFIVGGVFCEIVSASAPDADSKLAVATLPPTPKRGLRHGIYNHELTPQMIAAFLGEVIGPQPEAPKQTE